MWQSVLALRYGTVSVENFVGNKIRFLTVLTEDSSALTLGGSDRPHGLVPGHRKIPSIYHGAGRILGTQHTLINQI